jgi:hypothetical protein
LLLGPSPFGHWLESYLYITVRSLYFLQLQPGPPSSSSSLRAPLSLCRARVTPAAGRPRAPATLRHPDLTPRVALSLLPPPALPSLAVPRSSTLGRRSRAAATPSRRACRCRPLSATDSVTISLLPLLCEVMCCYRTDPKPLSLAYSSLLPPCANKVRRTFLAGICRDTFTPTKSPRPTVSSPPSLPPRPDPVQPPALLRRNRLHPEPPLAGAARRSPHRRQHPSATFSANLSMEIASPSPPDTLAHVRSSRSPVFRWERRRAATVAAPPRRRQGSTPARRAPPLPTVSPHHTGRASRSCQAGLSPLATSPPVGTCRSRRPVIVGDWQGSFCEGF